MIESFKSVTPVQRPYAPGDRVGVLLPVPLAATYDYIVPEETNLVAGDFVAVSFGRRDLVGVVWGRGSGNVPAHKLKTILHVFPVPALPEVSRRFVDWVAAYTAHSPGAVLRMVMSVPDALKPSKPVHAYVQASPLPDIRHTPARQRVLGLLSKRSPLLLSEMTSEAKVGPAVIKGLVDAGAIEVVVMSHDETSAPDWRVAGPLLSQAQSNAADNLRDAVVGGFSVTVLDGVPGSGKTEVYFEAVAETLKQGRQVLVLLPEIALGAQWLSRFHERFGAPPAQWHSDLTQGQRRRTWRSVAEGREGVVVGARSALFLPFPSLGLIIVDEEHESAFKQDDGVAYHARDMAVVRANLGDIPVVLASATPSLETVANVRSRRYRRLHMPHRHGGANAPCIEIVDLRARGPGRGRWLAPALRDALKETAAEGAQSLLFLNRRGYAPLTLCRACGHRLRCPSCTAWLVEHRLMGRLQCHHCGYSVPVPKSCPECGAEDNLTACGPGVERLAEEFEDAFPDLRYDLATSDTLTGPRAAAELVRRIEEHDVDVIIGTQIIAKGYHFPLLTLVGVVDADIGLAGGDLRAAERTYQLLYQVAGRAGRAERPGRVFVQTHIPDHPVIMALSKGNRNEFLLAESEARREAQMPPFSRLVALIVSGPNEAAVDASARDLARAAPGGDGIRVLGPAPAPMAFLRRRHRRRLLMKTPKNVNASVLARQWLASCRVLNSVRVQIDVDPYNFL